MADYLERFERLSHGILLYNTHYDYTYFVTRFLGGLTEEIHSVIALHRPKNVAEASALTLIQEEELAMSRKRFSLKDCSRSKMTTSSERSKLLPLDKSGSEKPKLGKSDNLEKLKELMQFR